MIALQGNMLSKLTIEGYQDVGLRHHVNTMQVSYNPTDLPLNYRFEYDKPPEGNSVGASELRFVRAIPQTLSLQLQFDADSPAIHTPKSLQQQLTDLRQLCGVLDITSLQPRFLRLTWGALDWNGDGAFIGRMTELSINYTLFDRTAQPTRATARLSLIEDREALKAHREQRSGKIGNVSMPSVVQVPDKASLAMMAAKSVATGLGTMNAQSPVSVLDLAVANGLDHLDDFKPGQILQWPNEAGGR